MHARKRKLIGAVVLLTLVIFWVLTAMLLAQFLPSVSGWVAWIFYVAAGLGWILPAKPVIRWMVRGDRPVQRIV